METKQPVWKIVGHVGDVNPIEYGGGFVYVDETGVYAPEMAWFEPLDDSWSGSTKEADWKLQTFRVLLEKDSCREWWYPRLNEMTSFLGVRLEELQTAATSENPLMLAQLYSDLIAFYSAENFDSYPVTLTQKEAKEKYSADLAFCRTGKR